MTHDTTFSDHTRVSMWKFMNSGTENGLYGIRKSGHIFVLQCYDHTALNSLETWRVFLVSRRAHYGVTASVPTVHYQLQQLHTYEIHNICIWNDTHKETYITFNKYARNCNYHNEMKTTVTLSTQAALSFSVAWNTPGMHIYKTKSVTRKRCNLRNT